MLRFYDSFDHYTTNAQLAKKWTSASSTGAAPRSGKGRNSTYGVTNNLTTGGGGDMQKTLSNQATWISGLAVYVITPNTANLFEWQDSGTAQIGVYFNNDGTFSIRRGGNGGTILETTSNSISTNTWYYVEFKATINNSGSYELRVNGVDWASASGVDTQQTANAYANTFRVNMYRSELVQWDDVYVCDDTGTTNNDFLGDVRIAAVLSDAIGTFSEWTPTAGDNYDTTNETTPNDDTDYVSTSGEGNRDTYNFGALPVPSGTVLGVQTVMYARKDDAGSRFIVPLVYYNSTLYSGSQQISVGDTYIFYTEIFEENPDTSNRWTISEINSTEFGTRLEG